MAKPKFTAEFSNGQVLTRSSHRAYTHAYLASGTMTGTRLQAYQAETQQPVSTTWDVSGFASSRALAERAMVSEVNFRKGPGAQYVVAFSEVVAVKGGAL